MTTTTTTTEEPMTTMTHEPQLTEGETCGRRTDLLLDGRLAAWRMAGNGVFEVCSRCGGDGHYSYNPVDGTRCFGCNGSGIGAATTEEDILRRARNRAKAAERRARRAAEAFEAAATAAETWRAEHPVLMQTLNDYRDKAGESGPEGILADLAEQADRRPLSDGQVELVDGLVAQIVERTAQREAQQAAGYFGEVGKRVEVDVEVVFTKYIHTERFDRSDSVLVVMRTAEGQTLKTFSSGAFGWGREKGQQLRIRGTVSEHGEYDGLPETMLKRVAEVAG
jgi:hypothetical protein